MSQKFHPGQRVAIHGLKSANRLNGRTGVLSGWDTQGERWAVKLRSEGTVAVRPANLKAVEKDYRGPASPTTKKIIVVDEVCASIGCKKPSNAMCERCRKTSYCGPTCQAEHFLHGGHKKYCISPEEAAANAATEVASAVADASNTAIYGADLEAGRECSICFEGSTDGNPVLHGGTNFNFPCQPCWNIPKAPSSSFPGIASRALMQTTWTRSPACHLPPTADAMRPAQDTSRILVRSGWGGVGQFARCWGCMSQVPVPLCQLRLS